MIHFGMPTLPEAESLEECCQFCHNLGLDFVELNMKMPEYQLDSLNTNMLKETAERYGIYYTIHMEPNLSPCDFNMRVAEAYTETVLLAIALAKNIGVPILNMHLAEGAGFSLPNKRANLFDVYEDVYLQKMTSFRNRCEEAIGEANVKICVENTDGYKRFPFLEKSLDLLLGSPVFALTFDIGHNATIGFADEPIILGRADRLKHMHVHDAKDGNSHLPLGAGELNLAKYLDLANKHGCSVLLETKTKNGLISSVEWLGKNWDT